MYFHKLTLAAVAFALLAACGATPKERKQHAEAEYTQEKTKTLQEYKKCVKKAKGDETKLNSCDALLKAVGALEGAK